MNASDKVKKSGSRKNSVIKVYRGMVSTFLSGLKDLTTDSVPDPPRPLTLETTTQNHTHTEPVKPPANEVNRTDRKEQEFDSDNSTPQTPKKKKPTKNFTKQQKTKGKQNDFDNPFNVKVSGNYTYITGSENFHIGPSFKQVIMAPSNAPAEVKIKKTEKIRALLVDETILNQDHLDTVSTHVGRKWREIGRILQFSEGQLDQFQMQGGQHLKETIYQMLLAWTQEYPDKATLGILSSALWDAGEREAVQRLVESLDLDE